MAEAAAVPMTHRIHSMSAVDAVGKHRLQAEMKRLEQEARFLEEELEQLEKMGKASTSCKELLGSVEMRSDPLLPETLGPVNPAWDRWFEGPKDSNRCRCQCRCLIL
ncbi:guanine nucleotide-binding protein subunit gamma 2-like [Momordica charantia]|uniref:Guanine nucleotide-binding protein subunit gamma 2-like n=1 Tax=Momordica charantia TaxID=3673 RepID=A0A6J1C8W8_MOMCH|nr:guanine nucleotide-binding protein subunit gamma 2-like [Momordica charantia]